MTQKIIDTQRDKLIAIVKRLRDRWPDKISEQDIKDEIQKLGEIKKLFWKGGKPTTSSKHYEYDEDKFPRITKQAFGAPTYPITNKTGPRNLAEALLWKKGDWEKYVRFVSDFKKKDSTVKTRESGPVFYAFSNHLKNRASNPIVDQHSARALWVLSEVAWDLDKEPFRHFLLETKSVNKKKKELWRSSTSPKHAANLTLEYFEKSVTEISEKNNIALLLFDDLLMPLGQALKHFARFDSTSNYNGLVKLVGLDPKPRTNAPTSS